MTSQQPMSEAARQQAEKAKRLVMYSHIFGWGGLGVLLFFAPALGITTRSGTLATIVAAVGLLATITGAVLGQVGRALQGRVI
jgi:hypothetical protein